MAVRAANLIHLESGLLRAAPAALLNGDQSSGMDLGLRALEAAAQVGGTFGVGGSISIEKSNDGSAWVALAAGDVVSGTHPVTAAGMVEFKTAARFVRFNVTAGDGTTSLTPVLIARPMRG